MEETRISRMYLAILQRWFGRVMGKAASGHWLASPTTWIVLVVLVLGGVGVALHERGRGHDSEVKTELGLGKPSVPDQTSSLEPGGQPPLILSREQTPAALAPEFVSVTLLPGRGMNVLQITAFVPGRGVVPLLASPSLEDAAKSMTGAGADAKGQASLSSGAPFEVPWAGRIDGAALPGGLSLQTTWQGQPITLPVNTAGSPAGAQGGLLLKEPASSVQSSPMPDGGLAETTFNAGSFDGHWPSNTAVKTTALLGIHRLELTVTARNTGTQPEPMGIGWSPRFVLPTASRAGLRLHLPSSTEANPATAHLIPVESSTDFSAPNGALLPAASLDKLYTPLKRGLFADGVETEWRDPTSGYRLRLTALSPRITAVHVVAPTQGGYLTIAPQTNLDHPLGKPWPSGSSGLVTLQPGESLEWKVRLEIFPPPGAVPTAPMPDHP